MGSLRRVLLICAYGLSLPGCGSKEVAPELANGGASNAAGATGISGEGGSEAVASAGAAGAGAAGEFEPPEPAACAPASARDASPLIDDFEDGDGTLEQPSNRSGHWYANNDGTGTQTPVSDPGGSSFTLDAPGSPDSPQYALHTVGSGFTSWGAFVSSDLNLQPGLLCPYDAASFSGVRFNFKGSGAVRVEFGLGATTPAPYGGRCEAERCSDYGFDISPSDDWTEVRVPFESARLPDWASPVPWDASDLVRLSFWVETGDFDFWIDDISFY